VDYRHAAARPGYAMRGIIDEIIIVYFTRPASALATIFGPMRLNLYIASAVVISENPSTTLNVIGSTCAMRGFVRF
jgi:hypothetical protein